MTMFYYLKFKAHLGMDAIIHKLNFFDWFSGLLLIISSYLFQHLYLSLTAI